MNAAELQHTCTYLNKQEQRYERKKIRKKNVVFQIVRKHSVRFVLQRISSALLFEHTADNGHFLQQWQQHFL